MEDYTLSDEEIQKYLDLIVKASSTYKLNLILHSLLYTTIRKAQAPLVEYIYELGGEQKEIGKRVGLTKSAISLQFPKKEIK